MCCRCGEIFKERFIANLLLNVARISRYLVKIWTEVCVGVYSDLQTYIYIYYETHRESTKRQVQPLAHA